MKTIAQSPNIFDIKDGLIGPLFLAAVPRVVNNERTEIEIPPDSDSRTIIFTLEAKSGSKTSGRSRIFIELI